MNWTYEEELLLVYVFHFSENRELAQSEDAIRTLSLCLQNYAKKCSGMKRLPRSFRNVAGIKMKLENIRYVATQGKRGLRAYSAMDEEVYTLSMKDPIRFSNEVEESKKQFDFPICDTYFEIINPEPTMGEKFGLNAASYTDMPIEALTNDTRICRSCHREKISTVSDLLRTRVRDFSRIGGLGTKSLGIVEEKLTNLRNEGVPDTSTETRDNGATGRENSEAYQDKIAKEVLSLLFQKVGDDICYRDCQWGNLDIATPEMVELAHDRWGEALDVIGEDLAKAAVSGNPSVCMAIRALKEYFDTREIEEKRREKLEAELDHIKGPKRYQRVEPYICVYTKDQEKQKALENIINEDTTFDNLLDNLDLTVSPVFVLLMNFLKWASCGIEDRIDELVKAVFVKPRDEKLILLRAEGYTLEETGNKLFITRERVRQIEAKMQRNFDLYNEKYRYLELISADLNGQRILGVDEVSDYFERDAVAVLYFLSHSKSKNYYFDKETESFYMGNISVGENLQVYMDTLPDIFDAAKVEMYIKTATEEYEIPGGIIRAEINRIYKLSGKVYHRYRLTLKEMYTTVLERFFPDGIHVNDDEEVSRFFEHVQEDFGGVSHSENNNAFRARISDIGILCGRGVYKPKQKVYISRELQDKIESYIQTSDSEIFSMNTLYEVFKPELMECGVNNRYYLQGILHEIFKSRFYFRRDYLCKTEDSTSMYDDIVRYIEKSPYPVTKEELQKVYPGLTDVVIGLATNTNQILNLFGEYLHVSHLKIFGHEKKELLEKVREIVHDARPHHIKEIYQQVQFSNEAIMSRNFIQSPFALFSLLSYLYKNRFSFARPYVAELGVNIEHPYKQLKELIKDKPVVEVDSVVNFAKDRHYGYGGILELLNSFDDTHFILSRDQLVAISETGLSENDISEIEDLILEEIDGCIPIASLGCIYNLKRINVRWTDWLLYSVIRKWSTRLEVSESNVQFRLAMPLVAPAGVITEEDLAEYSTKPVEEFPNLDELDNLDELIIDAIEDELEGWDDI